MEIFSIVLVIGVFIFLTVRINGLSADVEYLKRQLQKTGVAQPLDSQTQYQNTDNQFEPTEQNTVANTNFTPVSQIPAYAEPKENAFIAWLTEDLFMKLGALLLLMGFGWFVSYAFMNNWIGPVGRISLGLLAGMVIMLAGSWRIKNFRHQGSILCVLGSGVVLLTLFAARELYDFLTPSVSLFLMFLSVVYVAFVSVVYRSEKLALAGLLMAAIAPLLTNTPEPSVFGLMSYLLVVVLGTIWVVRLTGSHILTLASVIVMLLYSLPFFGFGVPQADEQVALLFSFVFALVFFVTNTISIIKVQTSTARKAQIFTALFTGAYLVSWIGLVIEESLQSLAFVFWMLLFSVGTFLVYTQTTSRVPFFIYGGVTIGLLFAATAAELAGPILTLAYTAEVTGIVLLVRKFLAKAVSEKLVWLLVLPILLSLESFDGYQWRSGFLHEDFIVLLTVGSALAIVGFVYLRTRVQEEAKNKFAEVLLGLAGFYFLALVWLVLHSVLSDDVATTASLIIYTLLGLFSFIYGKLENQRFWLICGGVLLGGVVARLLLVDVWQMDLVGRIVTFFVVGTLLISTAFIGKGKEETHE